jgi:hypothetical protein
MLLPVDACTTKRIREALHECQPTLDHHKLTRDACIKVLKSFDVNVIESDGSSEIAKPTTTTRGFHLQSLPGRSYSEGKANDMSQERTMAVSQELPIAVSKERQFVAASPPTPPMTRTDAIFSNLTINNRLNTSSLIVNNQTIDDQLNSISALKTQLTEDIVNINRDVARIDAAHRQAVNDNLYLYDKDDTVFYELTQNDIQPQTAISEISNINTVCKTVDSMVYVELSLTFTCRARALIENDFMIQIKLPFRADGILEYVSGLCYHQSDFTGEIQLTSMLTTACFISSNAPDIMNIRSTRFFPREGSTDELSHHVVCHLQYFRAFDGMLLSPTRFGNLFHRVFEHTDESYTSSSNFQWNIIGSQVDLFGNVRIRPTTSGLMSVSLELPLNANVPNTYVGNCLLHRLDGDIWSTYTTVHINSANQFVITYRSQFNQNEDYIAIFRICYEHSLTDYVTSFEFANSIVEASGNVQLKWTTNLKTNPYYFTDALSVTGPWDDQSTGELNIQGAGTEWFVILEVPSTVESGTIYATLTVFGHEYSASTLVNKGPPTAMTLTVELDAQHPSTGVVVSVESFDDDGIVPYTLELHATITGQADGEVEFVYDFTTASVPLTVAIGALKDGVEYGVYVLCKNSLNGATTRFDWAGNITTARLGYPTLHDSTYITTHYMPDPYFSYFEGLIAPNRRITLSTDFKVTFELETFVHAFDAVTVYTYISDRPLSFVSASESYVDPNTDVRVFNLSYESIVANPVMLSFPERVILEQAVTSISDGIQTSDALFLHVHLVDEALPVPDTIPVPHVKPSFTYHTPIAIDKIETLTAETIDRQSISVARSIDELRFVIKKSIPTSGAYLYTSLTASGAQLSIDRMDAGDTVECTILESHLVSSGTLTLAAVSLFEAQEYQVQYDREGDVTYSVTLTSDNYLSITAIVNTFDAKSDMPNILSVEVYDLSADIESIQEPSHTAVWSETPFIKTIFDTAPSEPLSIYGLAYDTKYMLSFTMTDPFDRKRTLEPLFIQTEGLPSFTIESIQQHGYVLHLTVTITSDQLPSNIVWYHRLTTATDGLMEYTSTPSSSETHTIVIDTYTSESYASNIGLIEHAEYLCEVYFTFGETETLQSIHDSQVVSMTGLFKNEIEAITPLVTSSDAVEVQFTYLGTINLKAVHLINTPFDTFEETIEVIPIDRYELTNIDNQYVLSVDPSNLTSGYLQVRVFTDIGGVVVHSTSAMDAVLFDSAPVSSVALTIYHASDGSQSLHIRDVVDDSPSPKIVKVVSLADGAILYDQVVRFKYPTEAVQTFEFESILDSIQIDISAYDVKYDIFEVEIGDGAQPSSVFYHPDVYLGRLNTTTPSINVNSLERTVDVEFRVVNFVSIDRAGICLVSHTLHGIDNDGNSVAIATTTPAQYRNGHTDNVYFTANHIYPTYHITSEVALTTLTATHEVGMVDVDLIDELYGDSSHIDTQLVDFSRVTAMSAATGVYAIARIRLDVGQLISTSDDELSIGYVYSIKSDDQSIKLKNESGVSVYNSVYSSVVVNSNSHLDLTITARTIPTRLADQVPIAGIVLNFENVDVSRTDVQVTHRLHSINVTSSHASVVLNLDEYEAQTILQMEYLTSSDGDPPIRGASTELSLLNYTLYTSTVADGWFQSHKTSPTDWVEPEI